MKKEFLYHLVEKYDFVMQRYLHFFNRFHCAADVIKVQGIRIRNNNFSVSGKMNSVKCGKNCSIQNNVFRIEGNNNTVEINDDVEILGNGKQSICILGNNNQIIIEDRCKIKDSSFFISGDNNIIHVSKDYSGIGVEFHIEQKCNELHVGHGTTMHGRGSRTVHIALDEGTKIIIGEDCMFSNDIQIRSSDSHSIVDLDGKRLNQAKDIKIGNHCWLGLGCLLLKGTEISDFTVVAAGSICTKKYIEPNVILAGNPAQIVKRNVNWDRKFL